MNDELREYVHSIIQYVKGDVNALLGAKLPVAGPLLAVISNGIDFLGGAYYGFHEMQGSCRRRNSEKRSFLFMKERMNMPGAIASFLYRDVRCGIVHEGIPKNGVAIFEDYNRPDKNDFLYKDEDRIYINVVEFAYRFLDTLSIIEKEVANGVVVPISATRDTNVPEYTLDDVRSLIRADYVIVLGRAPDPEELQLCTLFT